MMWGGNQFTPLLTVYRDRLHFADATVYALLGAYVLGLIPSLLVGNRLGARHGDALVVWVGLATGAAATVILMVGSTSVAATAGGRIVSGFSVGVAMTAGVSLIRALRLQASPSDTRGAVIRASMTLTAGLAAGAAVAGILGTVGELPLTAPYSLHLIVTAAAAATLLIGRPRRGPVSASQSAVAGLPAHRIRAVWALTAFMAPWVFVAGSVAYALVPGLIRDLPSAAVPAFAAVAALTTLTIGTLAQPWAARLLASGAPAFALALAMITIGMGVVIGVSAGGNWLIGLAATLPLGLGFGIAIATGTLRAEWVAARSGRPEIMGWFYSLTYIGFFAPALVSVVAASSSYMLVLVSITVLAASTTIAIAVIERRPGQAPLS